MRNRHFVFVLTLLVGLGAYAHRAEAIACPMHGTCAPSDNAGHTGFSDDGCFCAPLSAQLASHCSRPDRPSRWLRQVFVRSDYQSPRIYALGISPAGRPNLSILNRPGPSRGLHKSDSPLSYPIYLRTLALLC